jgi:ribosomal-protein-alanine N-acetyltransferase
MMESRIELDTKHLLLRVLDAEDAAKTLDFYKNNATIFEKYEPIDSRNFYTLPHQKKLLSYEYQQILQLHMLRFWLFEKSDPERIIGTISFHNLCSNPRIAVQIGYKMDSDYRQRGYCLEALTAAIHFLTQEIGIQKYEALVQPDNIPSIHLLEKLGFVPVNKKKRVFLNHGWQDHLIYEYRTFR